MAFILRFFGFGRRSDPDPVPVPIPWRSSSWDKVYENELKNDIMKLELKMKPKILIMGPIGAGKSSLINSFLTVSKGRKSALAWTGNKPTSYTLQFRHYKETSLLKNIHLLDCMGIEQRDDVGFNDDDIEFLLNGNIKPGYTFDPLKPMAKEDEFYNSSPKPEDKVHCVVFVVDASAINDMPKKYVDRIKQLQDNIQKFDVPRVLVLTKADRICGEAKQDPKHIFQSETIEEAVKYASEVFSIEPASTHPLVNYEDVFGVTTENNIPILLALRQIVQYACDKIEQYEQQP